MRDYRSWPRTIGVRTFKRQTRQLHHAEEEGRIRRPRQHFFDASGATFIYDVVQSTRLEVDNSAIESANAIVGWLSRRGCSWTRMPSVLLKQFAC